VSCFIYTDKFSNSEIKRGCGITEGGRNDVSHADHERPASPAVRVIRRADCSADTPQTDGIHRLVALDGKSLLNNRLSAFISSVEPFAWTAAHHHGEQDTILYVLSGEAAYAWGDKLEHVAWAGAGDFVFIPAGVIHQEINPSPDKVTEWVVVRSGAQPIVVNLTDLDQLAEDRAAACLHKQPPQRISDRGDEQ
jgi:uncharacterized RmlC-like cupin family protein